MQKLHFLLESKLLTFYLQSMSGKLFLILKTFSYLFLMELKLHYQKNLDLLNFDIVEFFLDNLIVFKPKPLIDSLTAGRLSGKDVVDKIIYKNRIDLE